MKKERVKEIINEQTETEAVKKVDDYFGGVMMKRLVKDKDALDRFRTHYINILMKSMGFTYKVAKKEVNDMINEFKTKGE